MRMLWLAGLLAASVPAFGADREFDRIVNAIESHYGVKRMHIPLMGVANLFVKVARPAGASSVKVAIFENLGSAPGYGEPADFDHVFDGLSTAGLRPIIRAHSRQHRESTYVCTGEIGKSVRMLIVTFASDEATVVAATVNMEAFLKTIGSPEIAGKMFGVKHDDW